MVEWLHLSQNSGSGDTEVTITASSNSELYERITSLTVSGISKSIDVIVEQDWKETTISITPTSYTFPTTGGTAEFTLECNTNWEITSKPAWLTLSTMSGTPGTYVITASAGTNTSHGVLKGNIVASGLSASASTYVKQMRDITVSDYLTFDIISDGLIFWETSNSRTVLSSTGFTIEYRINGGQWIEVTAYGASGQYLNNNFSVSIGDTVEFRGNYYVWTPELVGTVCQFRKSTAHFDVYGNAMSIIYKDDFSARTSFEWSNALESLFQGSNVYDASYLLLPATGITELCYYNMFKGSLLMYPMYELPALTVPRRAYCSMFEKCNYLKRAPHINATELLDPQDYGEQCLSMFAGCTSLQSTPYLHTTTLSTGCYYGMFSGCTSLAAVTELPASTLAYRCYSYMFAGCTSLMSPPPLPATTLGGFCYASMFKGCSKLQYAPALPATNIGYGEYNEMFMNCTSLIAAPELPATTLNTEPGNDVSYYERMFKGCTRLRTVPLIALQFYPGESGLTHTYSMREMFEGCTSLNYIKCLSNGRHVWGSYWFQDWIKGVGSSGTFVRAAGQDAESFWTWLRQTGQYNSIPQGWTVIEDS